VNSEQHALSLVITDEQQTTDYSAAVRSDGAGAVSADACHPLIVIPHDPWLLAELAAPVMQAPKETLPESAYCVDHRPWLG
jgi:hypothetical protein